jgi:hypothetical protein
MRYLKEERTENEELTRRRPAWVLGDETPVVEKAFQQ